MADERKYSVTNASTGEILNAFFSPPRQKMRRFARAGIGIRRGNMIRIAGYQNELGIRNVLLPVAEFLRRSIVAAVGRGHDQCRRGDIGNIACDIHPGQHAIDAEH